MDDLGGAHVDALLDVVLAAACSFGTRSASAIGWSIRKSWPWSLSEIAIGFCSTFSAAGARLRQVDRDAASSAAARRP